MKLHWNSPCLVLSLAGLVVAVSPSPAAPPKPPVYPRVSLTPHYRVDPHWPHTPPGITLGPVPSIAVDANDNIWVYTRANPVVQVYSAQGRHLRSWREEAAGTIPHSLKIDHDGNVWLVDTGLHVVRKYSTDGKVLLTLGTLAVAGTDEHHFFEPTDVAFTSNGDVFVADGYGNSRIAHFDRNGRFLKNWGALGTEPGQFSIPHAIATDSRDRLYVADRNNVRVQVFNASGALLDIWADILVPWSFWTSVRDDIWVCGSSPMPWIKDPQRPKAPLGCPPKDQLLMRFSPDGRLRQLWTLPKGEDGREKPGEVNWLHAIALDSKGNIYLGDIVGKMAQKFVRE